MRPLPPVLACALVLLVGPGLAARAAAQAAPPPAPSQPAAAAPRDRTPTTAGVFGMAVTVSSFGVGGDAALRLGRHVHVRGGYSAFSFTQDFDDAESQITYTGTLNLKAGHAYLDLFPFGGGFHISPGVVFANDTNARLRAAIPAGQKVTIDDTEYVSAPGNPLQASGAVTVAALKPAVVMGWGSLVPRTRRAAIMFEVGAVFQDAPSVTLGFSGAACATNGTNCRTVAADSTIQAEIQNQQAKLGRDLKVLRFYPIVSLGIGFRF